MAYTFQGMVSMQGDSYAASFDEVLNGRCVERPLAHTMVKRLLDEHGVCVICAGPGMGKTHLLVSCLQAHSDAGNPVTYVTLEGTGPFEAIRRLGGVVRRLRRDRLENELLGVDGVPAMDEGAAAEFSQLVASAKLAGAKVIVTMRPDAEQCAQALAVPCVRSVALGIPGEDATSTEDDVSPLPYSMTHGIPALVMAGGTSAEKRESWIAGMGEYLASLSDLGTKVLEEDLMDEERSQRGAMLLLGFGTLEDVGRATSPVDPDVARSLQADELLFGVDSACRTFDVAGLDIDDIASREDGLLGKVARTMPKVAFRCAEILASNGRFMRAGLLASCLPDGGDASALALEWPLELMDAGYIDLVLQAARSWKGDAEAQGSFMPIMARRALSCMGRGAWEGDELELPLAADAREGVVRDQGTLLDAAVGLLSGRRPPEDLTVASRKDPLARRLAAHLHAVELIFDGRFCDAFRFLLLSGNPRDGATISSALLAEDFEVARAFVGDVPNAMDDEAARRAASLVSDAGLATWSAYHATISSCLPLLVGHEGEPMRAERTMSRAAKRGDLVVSCVTYLATSILDLANGSAARAHVRASRAVELAGRFDAPALRAASDLVLALADGRAGDLQGLRALACPRPKGPLPSGDGMKGNRFEGFARMLAGLAAEALMGKDKELVTATGALVSDDLPADGLALLEMTICSLGDAGASLRAFVPEEWRARLASYEKSILQKGSGAFTASEFTGGDAPADPEVLRVNLLGGFQVMLGGVPIDTRSFRRKASRSILMYLAVAKSHTATRAELIEAIWPEGDYLRGRGSLYTALSTLRAALGGSEDGSTYVVGHGAELSLNPARVVCDVDELAAVASAMLDPEHDDAWLVRAARQVAAVYAGDLALPSCDDAGRFQRRREELRRLYVDAMVAGSRAARRLGDMPEAVRFAELACKRMPGREDAVLERMRALVEGGRQAEARDVYERHAMRAIEEDGLPPSAEMRRLMASIIPKTDGGSDATVDSYDEAPGAKAPEAKGKGTKGQSASKGSA